MISSVIHLPSSVAQTAKAEDKFPMLEAAIEKAEDEISSFAGVFRGVEAGFFSSEDENSWQKNPEVLSEKKIGTA